MRSRDFKDEVFVELARVGKALASPKRLELLELLAQGPKPVEALAEQTGMSVANTSQHLKALREARLVEVRREGLYRSYRLAGPEIAALYVTLRGVAERRLTEVQAITQSYLGDRALLEGVDAVELQRRALAGEVTVLDVRPTEEFAAGHLPGARSMPLEALACALAELPVDREVVAYCRGPYCVFAAQAVAQLREAGFTAWRLEQGPADWMAQGVALETSP